jgi:hypothetical protein
MKTKFAVMIVFAGFLFPQVSHGAWKFFNPTVESNVPAKFSQTGFYANWANKTVTPEAHYYEVNSPSWNDFAIPYRWLLLPPNTKIVFEDTSDYWDYPNGATFVQLFKQETAPGDSSTAIFWETRVLVNKEDTKYGMDEWYAFTYKWRPDGSEANLIGASVEDTVLNVALTFWPKGKSNPSSIRKWHYPDRYQCIQCHRTSFDGVEKTHARSILGFFTAQINRPSKADASVNQITELFNKGLLTWKSKGAAAPTPVEIATMPRWYAITDSSQDLNKRARAYLGANCSGCHGDRGISFGATMGARPNHDYYRGVSHQQLNTLELGSDYGIDSSRLLMPGKPEKSIVLYRQTQRASYARDVQLWNENADPSRPTNPELYWYMPRDAMPPLGTYEPDTTALKILTQWILTFDVAADRLERPVAIHSSNKPISLRLPYLQANHLVIPNDMQGRVTLVGIHGREYGLVPIASHVYSLPSTLKRGVYIIRVGAKSFTQYVD